jgi:hypothetical protein
MYGLFVHSSAQMPKGEHWAILEFGSIHIPGDERSRQAPGHGYPEHSEPTIGYEAFDSEAEMRSVMERRFKTTSDAMRYLGIHVTETFSGRMVSVVEAKS